jgi:D-alanine-D-alanine ligase
MKDILILPTSDRLHKSIASIALNGLPLNPADLSPKKIEKSIEIITVAKPSDMTENQRNVGIVLDVRIILSILSEHYKSVTVTEINTLDDLERLVARNPDLVFSGVKYFEFDGKVLWLNDYLDCFGIRYIASSKTALDLESNKSRAKDIMQGAGIATAHYFTTCPGEHPTEDSIQIAFPLFVKPITGGDSRGVNAKSVVNDFPEFVAKVAEIQNTQRTRSLVETYLSGREYSVGIFEDFSTGFLTAMPIEIIVKENANGNRILDFDIKKNDSEKVVAVTDPAIHKKLSDLAKAAFKALGGKSFGRIDVMMNGDEIPHFVEANLMPGLRKGYFYRSCFLNQKMSYEQMILKIADNGLSYSLARRENASQSCLSLVLPAAADYLA